MNFTGVAPDAKLGMWRIFGCDGGANEDTVIKGLLLAHEAGCNVINLSLGVQSAWSEDAMAVVAERLSQKGVIIVAVAGNQGDDGAFLQNTPGTAKHVVSVASLDNSYYPAKVFTLDAVRGDSFVYQLSTTTETFVNGTLVTVYDMDNTQAIHGCADDLPILQNHGQEIQGNVLLVRRGGCTFDEKAQTAEQVGAIAILVYDNEPTKGTDDEPFSIMAAKSNIPVAAIAPAVARQFLTNHLLPSNVVFPEATFDKSIKTALKVSAFSSVGPTYELDLKPNVAGIGGQVFSTLPRHLEGNGGFPTGWGVRSGTSMASPHVTAIIALVLQSFHQTPTHMEQSISTYVTEHLQNHAILPNQNLGNINHPLLQGAGLVQPLDTILNPLHVSPSSISFNDTSSSKYHRHTLRVTNYGQKPLNLVLKHLPADSLDTFGLEGQLAAHRGKPKVDTGLTLPLPLPLPIFGNRIHLRKRGPFASPADPSNAIEKLQAVNPFTPQEPTPPGHTKVQLELSRRQLSLGPGQSQTFDVEVRFPPTSEHVYQMYGGYIQLHLQESRQNDTLVQANIPYFGVLGRMHELPVFDDGFPFLSTSDNISNVIPSNRVFRFHPSSLLPHGGLHPGLSSGHHRELITRQLDEQGQDTSAQSSVVPGLPAFVCRLITASPKIHFQVLHESNHQVVGYLPDTPFEYWERNRLRADDFYRMIIWDGQIQAEPGSSAAKQTVAPGNYVVRISALHLLGDPNNPNDWDNWVSGPILVE
ncbi:subtilisin-like protein [Hesseltinella vesiculosa]|uniref:Subtilisin-like protein n=1 Tax=Hesseltinella vesiculosa TaxID=101127 RepID=A0A1X2GMT4_9FUNG|nr:subtilisin-like protein [Hesseltinella vesiculosa]